MSKQSFLFLFLALCSAVQAQEVLLPLRHGGASSPKSAPVTLPFFDDFCDGTSSGRWYFDGAMRNDGFAPLPPTVGMVTLDVYDADGELYPANSDEMTQCDGLESATIRLDSCFYPYPRKVVPEDSVFLSFYYLPGGGYGNMWERIGDTPEDDDSLVLQFYAPGEDRWHTVWSREGISPDTLFARTGHYWQQVMIPIVEDAYLQRGFRFRFINFASIASSTKPGILANADQWNIDYVYLDLDRGVADTFYRDIAFVNPAPSLLRRYQAMPARQFTAEEMKDTLSMTITNLFSEELACRYDYRVLDADGALLHSYEGGFDNIQPYMPGMHYQTSAVHARPPVGYVLPVEDNGTSEFLVVHNVREGVGPSSPLDTMLSYNDTVSYRLRFDNYYAYDDGVPENGYGLTSTNVTVSLACQYELNVEDTLTAVSLYFNRTMGEENASIPFKLTVWDDQDGQPGNVIYQDSQNRKPRFDGLNQYVKYQLESDVLCNGTIYVGFLQQNTDYINLGFDRNNDASAHIFYLTDGTWQTSILRGALMLRPYFGRRGRVGIEQAQSPLPLHAYAQGRRIVIEQPQAGSIVIYNTLGQQVYATHAQAARVVTPDLRKGLYIVKSAQSLPVKVLIAL